MKLNFSILADDGMLEARELDRVYIIFQNGNQYNATVNGENLIFGDLYECLDACNNHAYDILNRKILDVEKELAGCLYKKVNEMAFKDHTGEYAIVMPRRFKSLESVKNFIQEQSKEAVVYVYDLREYHLDRIWYYIRCAIRKK